MNIRLLLISLLSLLSILLIGCKARPEESDLVRVKEHFLQMRFQAAFRPELQSKSDMDLFLLSCEQNRVRCDPLLEMLKEKDRPFYDALKGVPAAKK